MTSEDDVIVRVFKAEDDESLLEECLEVRRRVFVVEQGVDESIDKDSLDDQCMHIALSLPELHYGNESKETVATCRLRCHSPYVKLERVAVLKVHFKHDCLKYNFSIGSYLF